MAQIEFFTDNKGTIWYREGDATRQFTSNEAYIISTMYGIIQRKFPTTYKYLIKLYEDRYTIVKRFIVCNLMNDDLVSCDLSDDSINIEDVRCPLRGGLCNMEGKICRCYRQVDVSDEEILIVRMLRDGAEYTDIAKHLKIGIDALRKRVSKLKHRTGAKNRFELIKLLAL